MGQSKPTQKTIAQMMGVAVTTVSRALQGDPKIAAATRREVARVAAEIGYVPDRAAQLLRTGKTHVVSLILNPHDEILGFGNSMISGLSQSLEGSDYNLTITPHFSDQDELDLIRHLVQNGLADGLIVTRTRNFDDRVRYLLENEFPFVTHGRTDFSQAHNFVDYDNEAFAYMASRHLATKGRKKLMIFLPNDSLTFYQHLQYGFMKAVRETGLEYLIPQQVTLETSPEELKGEIAKALEAGVDGFVCPGESSFLALFALMRDRGLVRGRDYDVVVKSNSTILEQIDPKLDRVFEDIRDAGRLLGQILLKQLLGETTEKQGVVQAPLAHFA